MLVLLDVRDEVRCNGDTMFCVSMQPGEWRKGRDFIAVKVHVVAGKKVELIGDYCTGIEIHFY